MEKVLVPVDLTLQSEAAMAMARQLSIQGVREIFLLNVFSEERAKRGDGGATSKAEAMEKLQSIREEWKANNPNKNAIVKPIVVEGDPIELIVRFSVKVNADVIIMGTEGATSAGEAFTGTTSSAVIRESNKPVLVVPIGTKVEKISGIVYGTILLKEEELSLRQLSSFAWMLNAKIHALNVQDNASSVDQSQIDQTKDLLRESMDYDNFEFSVVESLDVQDAMMDYAKDRDIQMMALLTRRRKFLDGLFNPSLTKRVAMYADLPLLVLQAKGY